MSPFPKVVLREKLRKGYKVPKFIKFSIEIGEPTIEHITKYHRLKL